MGSRFARLSELHPRRFFLENWQRIDQEAEHEQQARRQSGRGYDWRPLIALCSGAVFLALMEYFGHAPTMVSLMNYFDPLGADPSDSGFWQTLRHSPFRRLAEFAWWSGWRVLGFFLLPCLVIRLVFRERIRDYGLSTEGFSEHLWIYLTFFLIVLGCVAVVSFDSSFNEYYPFYRQASRSWFDFCCWELLYAAQFFSLEFFFRGFWLKAGKSALGSQVIFAMVVPYCMIHFGKPFLETIAAIFAGVVLGTLALKTRSIWSGFLIHVSVALSMDLAALMQTRGLPAQWWPTL